MQFLLDWDLGLAGFGTDCTFLVLLFVEGDR
jgi:hypothetical protein